MQLLAHGTYFLGETIFARQINLRREISILPFARYIFFIFVLSDARDRVRYIHGQRVKENISVYIHYN